MKILHKSLYSLLFIVMINCQDPFLVLGIPSLNPRDIFKDGTISISSSVKNKKPNKENLKSFHSVKSIEDLAEFLKESHISNEERVKIISRFLMADDFFLKKYGAIFDQTGFDGLMSMEQIYPVGHKDRLTQMARSAAQIFFENNYQRNQYEAYGAEEMKASIVNRWHLYKVLMIGKSSVKDHIFLKVCISEDDMLVPLVVQMNGNCINIIKYVEEAKIKNIPYLDNIKRNFFGQFKKDIDPKEQFKAVQQNNLKNVKSLINNPPLLHNDSNIKRHFIETTNEIKKNENNFQISPSFLMKDEVSKTKTLSQSFPTNDKKLNDISLRNQAISNLSNSQTTSKIGTSIDQYPQNIKALANINNSKDIHHNINNYSSEKEIELEKKIERMNEKLNKLEKKVENNEKITMNTKEDMKDLKINLDTNFNKLDSILEKIATKLK